MISSNIPFPKFSCIPLFIQSTQFYLLILSNSFSCSFFILVYYIFHIHGKVSTYFICSVFFPLVLLLTKLQGFLVSQCFCLISRFPFFFFKKIVLTISAYINLHIVYFSMWFTFYRHQHINHNIFNCQTITTTSVSYLSVLWSPECLFHTDFLVFCQVFVFICQQMNVALDDRSSNCSRVFSYTNEKRLQNFISVTFFFSQKVGLRLQVCFTMLISPSTALSILKPLCEKRRVDLQ